MTLETILTVKNEHLNGFGPATAVEVFRELVWAEASRIGIPFDKINVSDWINMPDGGVDATVRETEGLALSNFIQSGHNAYQIKAGKDFKPWQPSQVKKELFGDKPVGKDNLGSSIRCALDQKGRYVLVCFGQDLVTTQQQEATKNLRCYLEKCGYDNPRVAIWGQNTIRSFLQPFPALALRVNRRQYGGFETHQEWARHEEMRRPFRSGYTQDKLIDQLRVALREVDNPVHIRIWGEAGIGKTRLVLEATRADDLSPTVIYSSASLFKDSNLMTTMLRDDFTAILILDECDSSNRAYIWDAFRYHSPRIKIVSIYNERDDSSGILYFDLPPLEKPQVSSIIQSYGVPRDQADRWAKECSGSPRVAHVVGMNLVNNPEDMLKPPGTVDLWERYIVGLDNAESVEVRQRRLVLRHMALFKRFGYGHSLTAEAKAIAALVERANPLITLSRFQEIVRTLRKRKILQGETTLYITPQLLHIKLWLDWWNTYGEGFSLNYLADLPPTLITWFFEMFKYAAGSPAASHTVREILGPNGLFQQNPQLLRQGIGPRFFRFLAKADPEGALACLKNTIGTWNRKQLTEFKTGRRETVWALQDIAKWRHLFADAAKLLLALGEAENESFSNNASGVFAGLFVISEHKVFSPTGAPPEERLPILKAALESDSRERRELALLACDRALQRVTVGEISGSPKIVGHKPKLWVPKTYGELFDAYREIWQFLFGKLESLPEEEQCKGVSILLKNARSLGQFRNLSDMIIEAVRELSERPYVDKEEILELVTQILHYDRQHLVAQERDRWSELKDRLGGIDFSSRLERYVKMDIFLDHFDENGNQVDQAAALIEQLARQVIEDPKRLCSELDWLVTAQAKKGYRFGYEIGRQDGGFSLLSCIIEAQSLAEEEPSLYFLGGYLRALFEQDPQEWENLMDSFAEDKNKRQWVPELTWRLGQITDRSGWRIVGLMEDGSLTAGQLSGFIYGGVIQDLSEDTFKAWLDQLIIEASIRAAQLALALFSHYYLDENAKDRPPENLTYRILTNPPLLSGSEAVRSNQMATYHWTKIGSAFVNLYPIRSLELAEFMLQHFAEDGTIFEGFDSRASTVLAEILQQHPEEMWKRIAKLLGPPIDLRAHHLGRWLRGKDLFREEEVGSLSLVPPHVVWEWVDKDVEERAWYLATMVPKSLFHSEDRMCWARQVLVRYGEREEVRRNLSANLSTEGWLGPESVYLREKRQQLLKFRENEENSNVRLWIDEYVAELDQRIRGAEITEERENF